MPNRMAVGALALGLLCGVDAHAQGLDAAADYPDRTVHIVVSAPPGGGPDIVARLLADKLQQRWGRAFVVENHPGAGGTLGADAVAHAAADGYTLLAAQPSPLTTSALLYKKLNFDPAAFEPVAIITWFPSLLMARPDFPAHSAAQLIVHAKAHPGTVTFASQGIGTTPHLTGELLAQVTGIELVHVPYRGTVQAVNDLIAGHVDLMFLELALASQLVKGRQAMALAIATEQRLPSLPDIPTLEEAGLPVRSDSWNAIAAPPKTPAAIVAKLNAAINDILKAPDIEAHLRGLSMQPVGGTPAQAAQFIKADTRRWSDVIRAANITAN